VLIFAVIFTQCSVSVFFCRAYSRAYRVTYSLLTTFGQQFPVIVSDLTVNDSEPETQC